MGLYDKFKSDKSLEINGVWVNYGDFRVLLARAGGSNKKYATIAERVLEPLRRQMKSGTMDNNVAEEAMITILCEACILGWETKRGDGAWISGIEDEYGDVIPFSVENAKITLRNLPDLFAEIRDVSSDMKVYRESQLEDEAKNS